MPRITPPTAPRPSLAVLPITVARERHRPRSERTLTLRVSGDNPGTLCTDTAADEMLLGTLTEFQVRPSTVHLLFHAACARASSSSSGPTSPRSSPAGRPEAQQKRPGRQRRLPGPSLRPGPDGPF